MAIFVTGDTHGGIDIAKLHRSRWPEQQSLTKRDYLIILGDFGGVWREGNTELVDLLEKRPFTTLSILGNHENYDLIKKLPIKKMFGGEVRVISPSVFFLLNGQVYTINKSKFFVMGGAYSIDKSSRHVGTSWWPEEIPSYSEIEEGIKNLEKHDNQVDYVLTHTCTTPMAEYLRMTQYEDPTNKILDEFERRIKYKMWYCGHMHIDRRIGSTRFMYDDVRMLGT